MRTSYAVGCNNRVNFEIARNAVGRSRSNVWRHVWYCRQKKKWVYWTKVIIDEVETMPCTLGSRSEEDISNCGLVWPVYISENPIYTLIVIFCYSMFMSKWWPLLLSSSLGHFHINKVILGHCVCWFTNGRRKLRQVSIAVSFSFHLIYAAAIKQIMLMILSLCSLWRNELQLLQPLLMLQLLLEIPSYGGKWSVAHTTTVSQGGPTRLISKKEKPIPKAIKTK